MKTLHWQGYIFLHVTVVVDGKFRVFADNSQWAVLQREKTEHSDMIRCSRGRTVPATVTWDTCLHENTFGSQQHLHQENTFSMNVKRNNANNCVVFCTFVVSSTSVGSVSLKARNPCFINSSNSPANDKYSVPFCLCGTAWKNQNTEKSKTLCWTIPPLGLNQGRTRVNPWPHWTCR